MGRYGIITGFDNEANMATFEANATSITLRMLLSHTSGQSTTGLTRSSPNSAPRAAKFPGAA